MCCNLSKQKIIQIGLKGLVDRWPMFKTWSTLPNWALYEIGLAIIESESWGTLVYLPKEIDKMIDEKLQYDADLYYIRIGKGYVCDDGLHAIDGGLESFITIN